MQFVIRETCSWRCASFSGYKHAPLFDSWHNGRDLHPQPTPSPPPPPCPYSCSMCGVPFLPPAACFTASVGSCQMGITQKNKKKMGRGGESFKIAFTPQKKNIGEKSELASQHSAQKNDLDFWVYCPCEERSASP